MFKKYKHQISTLEKKVQSIEKNKIKLSEHNLSEHNQSVLHEFLSFELEQTERKLKKMKLLPSFLSMMLLLLSFICTSLSVFVSNPYSLYIGTSANVLCIIAIVVMVEKLEDVEDEKKRDHFYALYAIPFSISILAAISRFLGY